MSRYNLRKRKRDESHQDIYDEEDEIQEKKKSKLEEDLFGLEESPNRSSESSSIDLVAEEKSSESEFCNEFDELNLYNSGSEGETYQGLESDVHKIISEIKNDEPTLYKIINTPMSMYERKDIFQLYEIYKTLEPGTLEHYDLRKRLISILSQLATTDYNERNMIEEKISKIPKIVNTNGIFEMKKKIIDLPTTDWNKGALLELVREYTEADTTTNTFVNIREKLNFALSLPYTKRSPPLLGNFASLNELCVHVRKVLDQELYGMEHVKDSLISAIVNKYNNPSARMCIALKGEPGVGKTDICKAFAKAIGRPFGLIALGSVSDATSLTGSMNWYVGSSPGLILQFMRRAGVCDGILLYDEIDKMMEKDRSIENAMKDITDYTKNMEFRDTYLSELSHNISEIWSFFTLNDEKKLDPVLRNRLFIIQVPSYTMEEIITITTNYLLPKAIENLGAKGTYHITEDGCMAIINKAVDKSIRQIDAVLRDILSKISTIKGTMLPDGTFGKLKLSYSCKNIGDHTVIDRSVVKDLTEHIEEFGNSAWKTMYA